MIEEQGYMSQAATLRVQYCVDQTGNSKGWCHYHFQAHEGPLYQVTPTGDFSSLRRNKKEHKEPEI